MSQISQKHIVLVSTHPIQYQVPWFQALAKCKEYRVTVLFGILPDESQQGIGFGKSFTWDIPLLEGYRWEVLNNESSNPGLGKFNGIDTPNMKRKLKDLQPDVLILTGWQSKMLIQAILAAKRLRIKTIVRGESNAMQSRPLYKRLVHRFLMKQFNAFLSIGISNKRFYLNNGVAEKRIFDAPYFVDNRRFDSANLMASEAEFPQDHIIPFSDFCFLYSGKFSKKKNVMELLYAFSIVHKKIPKTCLLLIGSGELEAEMTAFAASENLPITFFGFVNQSALPSYYSMGNCFVLCSDYGETWGLVTNEAMLSGMPAIVSDRVGCGQDLVINGVTGSVYPFGNVDALAEKMQEMAENFKRTENMGVAAKQRVLEFYNLDRTTEATKQAILFLE